MAQVYRQCPTTSQLLCRWDPILRAMKYSLESSVNSPYGFSTARVFRTGGIRSIGGLPGAATVGTGGCSLTGNYSPGHPGIPPPIFYSCFIYLTYSYFIGLLKRRDNKNLGKKKPKNMSPCRIRNTVNSAKRVLERTRIELAALDFHLGTE